jgi:DUF1009 family protein
MKILPPDHDPSAHHVLISGKGNYPILLAARAKAAGIPLRLIAFEGETPPRLYDTFRPEHRTRIKVGQLGKMLKALQNLDAKYAIMAGQISPGKLFKGLHPDLKAVALLASLKEKNAETIFGAIADEITKVGTTLLDARSFMEEDLAEGGIMVGKIPDKHWDYLEHGIKIATEVSRLDIGQAVVVRKGTVLAVEPYDGTDALIDYCAKFRTRDAILVKTSKPNQDYRFDVPVFGEKTLEKLAAAQIHTAAVAAHSTLLLDKTNLLKQAKSLKINLIGFMPPNEKKR